MTVDQMRERITNAYPGLEWKDRVARMEDKQVVAIFNSCEERGVFKRLIGGGRVKQLSIDDILGKDAFTWEAKYEGDENEWLI